MTPAPRAAQGGFSLIEALVAMALMGAVLAGLATVTAQWLPNWSRGFAGVQRNELLERGLERLVTDLSAAEYVPRGGGSAHPLFIGSAFSVTFVRPALGPNTRPGLEIVRITEAADQRGPALVRTRARFTPAGPNDKAALLPRLKDPVVLLHAPYRVRFSFAGEDRKWKDEWRDTARLPRAVRLLVRDGASQQILPISTVVTLHVDAPPACQESGKTAGCADGTLSQTKTDKDTSGPPIPGDTAPVQP